MSQANERMFQTPPGMNVETTPPRKSSHVNRTLFDSGGSGKSGMRNRHGSQEVRSAPLRSKSMDLGVDFIGKLPSPMTSPTRTERTVHPTAHIIKDAMRIVRQYRTIKANTPKKSPARQRRVEPNHVWNRSTRAAESALLPTSLFMLAVLIFGFIRYMPDLLDELGVENGDPACGRLTSWIREHDGWVTGVRCVNAPQSGGRGIIAIGNIQEGERYASIPQAVWFWEGSVREESEIGDILADDEFLEEEIGSIWAETGDPIRLILALAYEKLNLNESFWKPFIDSMPQQPTSPIWWPEQQLDNFESEVLKKGIITLKTTLERTYNEYMPTLAERYPEVFDLNELTMDVWKWSALHVYGRAFDAQHPTDPQLRTWALIPVIDLVNHQGYPDGGYGDSDGPGPFTAEATTCVRHGGELFHSYGSSKSSTHYLLTYGFIPTGYTHSDYIAFSLSNIVEGSIRTKDKYALRKNKWFAGYAGTDGHITEEFIDSLAFYIENQFPNENGDWAKKRALTILRTQVERHLSKFSTTYEEDFEALSGPFPGYDTWVVLTARTRFKAIMLKLVDTLTNRLGSEDVLEPSSWGTTEAHWSMVHDRGDINPSNKIHSVEKSLYTITLGEEDILN
eukprot:m.29568 g.29568  ORF g.29568 m.29568 type:complete len:622 (-) comp16120_c0_seq1:128-1993(-)